MAIVDADFRYSRVKVNLHSLMKSKMYQDGCYGCSQSFLWSGYRTSSYPRKPASFHIMDILHIRPDHKVPSALGPLQDFCRTKSVQNIVSHNTERTQTPLEREKDLKFGINRILSEEFGNRGSVSNGMFNNVIRITY